MRIGLDDDTTKNVGSRTRLVGHLMPAPYPSMLGDLNEPCAMLKHLGNCLGVVLCESFCLLAGGGERVFGCVAVHLLDRKRAILENDRHGKERHEHLTRRR